MELGVSHVLSLSSSTPIVDNIFDKYNKKFGTHKIFFQIMTLVYCSITLHVNFKNSSFRELSSTYHGKDGHQG